MSTPKSFLSQLSTPARDALQKVLTEHRTREGEILFEQGERPTHLFFVREGWIKISLMTRQGREVITELLYPGDFCGASCCLFEETYPATATCLEDGVIGLIKKEHFEKLAEAHPSLVRGALTTCNDKRREQQAMLASLAVDTARQRAARMLYSLAIRLGRRKGDFLEFSLPFDRVEISQLIGTTPETTIRSLSSMKREGILTESEGIMRVSPRALREVFDSQTGCASCMAV